MKKIWLTTLVVAAAVLLVPALQPVAMGESLEQAALPMTSQLEDIQPLISMILPLCTLPISCIMPILSLCCTICCMPISSILSLLCVIPSLCCGVLTPIMSCLPLCLSKCGAFTIAPIMGGLLGFSGIGVVVAVAGILAGMIAATCPALTGGLRTLGYCLNPGGALTPCCICPGCAPLTWLCWPAPLLAWGAANVPWLIALVAGAIAGGLVLLCPPGWLVEGLAACCCAGCYSIPSALLALCGCCAGCIGAL